MKRIPLIRTIEPVLVDSKLGVWKVLYFDSSVMTIDEDEFFKGELGCVTHIVRTLEKLEDDTFNWIDNNPICAKYKLSTYLNILDLKPSELLTRKAELMIAQIDFNSAQYYGLKANDLQILNPE